MLALATAILCLAQPEPINVILLIGDGMGESQMLAASMVQGRVGKQLWDQKGWTQLWMATYPLRMEKAPGGTGRQDLNLVYDPARAWNADDQYRWLQSTPTDSGASATAMATGQKVYKHSLCWSDTEQRLENVGDRYRAAGKAFGVVTSVEWSDATPAAFLAHNRNRDNRVQVAREMVEESGATVIMGVCHPWYDGHGRRLEKMGDASWVGEQPYITSEVPRWKDLRFIESKADFEALAAGKLDLMGAKRLVGTVRAAAGTQIERDTRDWNRDGKVDRDDIRLAPLNGDPRVTTVPDLPTMTRGALNLVSKNSRGFFLMVESGAIDHAGHYNWSARIVEEAIEFVRTIEEVDRWVQRNGGYSKNLVLITGDHETGALYGPESDRVPFQPIQDRGRGNLPGMRFNSGGHTNVLIPLWARGPGAERLAASATLRDPRRGPYVNNTDLFPVLVAGARALTTSRTPRP